MGHNFTYINRRSKLSTPHENHGLDLHFHSKNKDDPCRISWILEGISVLKIMVEDTFRHCVTVMALIYFAK